MLNKHHTLDLSSLVLKGLDEESQIDHSFLHIKIFL